MVKRILFLIGSLIILSLGLAWVSSRFESLQGWGSFLGVSTLGAGLLTLCWLALRRESIPRWVLWLTIAAAILRLLIGVFWTLALPEWGYGSDAELAGYIMSDAQKRDMAAWEFAHVDTFWLQAFDGYRSVDQYGGLLFFSAAMYKFFGGAIHLPLMMVVVSAVFSSLALLFTWDFTRRIWDRRVATLAVWFLALNPEGVLLGSSQMREAFTITLAASAIYGLVLALKERSWQGAVWMIASLALGLPLSPTFSLLLILTLVLVSLCLRRLDWLRDWRTWLAWAGLLIVGILGLWFFGAQVAPQEGMGPFEILQHWLERTRIWETILSQQSSGWMHKVFSGLPGHIYGWIILLYGVVQPFLPAALIANGNWLWRGIAIWRALGWTVLLPFLVYAPLRALRKPRQWFVLVSSLAIWIVIFASSYRSGGDLWDNPRYRVAFASLQIALAAWVWVEQRRTPDPWLRRVLLGIGFVLLWFIPWYLRRYTPIDWPVVDVFKTIGLGVANAILYWIWDWARSGSTQAGTS
jgi:hypothetical protein